jgi:hypothetical protein
MNSKLFEPRRIRESTARPSAMEGRLARQLRVLSDGAPIPPLPRRLGRPRRRRYVLMAVRFAAVALLALAVTGMATAAAYVVRRGWPIVATSTRATEGQARDLRPSKPATQPQHILARLEPSLEPSGAPAVDPAAASVKTVAQPSESPKPVISARGTRKPAGASRLSSPPGAPEVLPAPAARAGEPPSPYRSPEQVRAVPTSTKEPAELAVPAVSPGSSPTSGESSGSPQVRPEGVSQEANLLRQALSALRRDHDPRRALALLDDYDRRFGQGMLAREAASARAQALLKLGDNAGALSLLDGLPLGHDGQTGELRVIRGELRSLSGRCRDALGDFDAVLRSSQGGDRDEIARALFGRASCRARTGDRAGAEQDRQRYLKEFPQGPAAKQLLSPP